MAKKNSAYDDDDAAPVSLPDPDMAADDESNGERKSFIDKSFFEGIPWLRGLQSLFFLVAAYVAGWILLLATVIQWFWMAITKEKNEQIASFGAGLAKWIHDVTRFQTGDSDEKPFPWKGWGA